MDCSPPGSSAYEVLQGRILEWVAILFSGEPSSPLFLPDPSTSNLFTGAVGSASKMDLCCVLFSPLCPALSCHLSPGWLLWRQQPMPRSPGLHLCLHPQINEHRTHTPPDATALPHSLTQLQLLCHSFCCLNMSNHLLPTPGPLHLLLPLLKGSSHQIGTRLFLIVQVSPLRSLGWSCYPK